MHRYGGAEIQRVFAPSHAFEGGEVVRRETRVQGGGSHMPPDLVGEGVDDARRPFSEKGCRGLRGGRDAQ